MNFKTTFVLLVLVIIGAGLWILTARFQPATEVEDDEQSPASQTRYALDPRPEPKDVGRIVFARHEQPTIVFEKQVVDHDGPEPVEDWRMIEPIDSATVGYMVDGLVTMLNGLQYRRSFQPSAAGGVSPTEAGLDPPAGTLTMIEREGKEYAIEIGKRVALSNDMYIRVVGSEEISVVGRDMTPDLERPVNDYRDRALMDFTVADVRHLRVDHQGTTCDFSLGAGDEWVINEPIKAYARAPKVKALLNSLRSVRVKEFIEDAPERLTEYGLDAAYLAVCVTTEKRKQVVEEPKDAEEPATQPAEPRFELVTETHALTVGGYADLKSETRYVKLPDQPWVANAATNQLDKLEPELSELRDSRITRVRADDVTRLQIIVGDATATLEKTGGKWEGTGDLAQLEIEAVSKLLRALEDVSAIDYIDEPQDPAAYGLDEPRAVLRATTAGAVEPVSLLIGADTESSMNTYVQVAGQQSVMVVRSERAAELVVQPLALRSRVMTSIRPEQIKQVELERGDKRYVLERAEDGSGWRMLDPPDAPPERDGVRKLVNDLSRLRARQVIAKDADAEFGLTEPALTIRFVTEKPVEIEGPPAPVETQPSTQPAEPEVERVEHTLLVGRKNDKTYARIDDDRYVFELDETVYRVLTEELISRGLFDIDAASVGYLKIEAPGGVVEFQLEDEKWIYPPDKFLKLSQKKVGDFVKELAELRVQAYVAYRKGDLAGHNLESAPVTVTLRLAGESAITLKIGQVRPGELPRKAAWVEQQRIFLLRPAEAEKLMRGLDFYVKPDAKTGDKQE